MFSFEELLKGLEERIKRERRGINSITKFSNRVDFDSYLERFQGIEVDGVTVELSTENSEKYEVLLGIFVDKNDEGTS